ncbi:MAG: SDR family oxidoreductase, partial [Alphaproteobacteria bacterium]|nr:SDR family oxidoreductase [Alphaproteobacteria bacterium]
MSVRKAIFITGGGSGIGRATALFFASKGWFVGVADMNETGIAETRARLPQGQSSGHVMDVRRREDWAKALGDFTALTGGRLDVMFNNAGVARGGWFASVPPEHNDLTIDVNFTGVVYGVEAAFPYLKATDGPCLVNTASAAGIYGVPKSAVYSATKFAVRGLSEGLDCEWRRDGIKVRCIMPSFINTPLLEAHVSGTNRNVREDVTRSGLEITPVEEVAQTVWDAVHGDKVNWTVGKTAKR